MNPDPSLPPGTTDRDIDGPEPRDDNDMTQRDRDEEAKGEARGDQEDRGQ